jgi:threonine dehydratase
VHGRNFNAAHEYAKTRARELDRTYLHPFANPWTIAGQATIGRELVEQAPDMTTLVLPVGGGSLLAGAASVVRQHLPDVRIVAAQVERCTAYVDSLRMARRQVATDVDTRFGGLAVSRTNPLTLALGSRLVDQVIVLDSRLVYETVDIYKEHEGVLLDETGATGVAATRYLASLATNGDEKFVTVATGANPDPDLKNYAAAVARRLAYERQTTVLANATC